MEIPRLLLVAFALLAADFFATNRLGQVERIGKINALFRLATPASGPPAPAKAARSKAWHGFARSGHAAQDGLR
jgi:hypothetical protein